MGQNKTVSRDQGQAFLRSVGMLGFLSLITLSAGCFGGSPRGDQSILILAVSNLRSDDLGCGSGSDSVTPQLDIICNESVRFTHAYTPAVLDVPALASLLTGLYPVEHGVRNNGPSLYDENVQSIPQLITERGHETFFVSGGTPFLRKAGVSKGFVDFDDTVRADGGYYRPADTLVKRFAYLVENRSENTPFFGVVHFADLSFPEIVNFPATQAEHIEGSYNGKLQEIDTAVGWLRHELQKQKVWDPLTVVFVGLSGRSKGEHDGLAKGLSLYDEIVRVPVLIKPSRKPRDLAPSWKVDEPITLVDLGVTLQSLFKMKPKIVSKFDVRDVSDALLGHNISRDERAIFTESQLPKWRGWGSRLSQMRVSEWVLFGEPQSKMFNTYTDHLEQRDLYGLDHLNLQRLIKIWQESASIWESSSTAQDSHAVINSIGEKLKLARVIFSATSTVEEKIRAVNDLELRRPHDWQIMQWHTQILLEAQDWPALKELVIQKSLKVDDSNKAELQLWRAFSTLRSHTKIRDEDLKNNPSFNCLYLALALKKINFEGPEAVFDDKSCHDEETQAWIKSYLNFRFKKLKESNAFFDQARNASDKRLDQTEFGKAFWIEGATWDYPETLPAGPALLDFFTVVASNPDFAAFTKRKQGP